MCNTTDKPQKQWVLWKKPGRKEYKLYDSISMKLWGLLIYKIEVRLGLLPEAKGVGMGDWLYTCTEQPFFFF